MKLFALVFAGLLSTSAFAKTCELTISGNDAMKFDKSILEVESSCTEVKLTLKHTGKLKKNIMGHNWVLTKVADKAEVVKSAEKAGAAKDFTPTGPKVIATTKLIGGGESTTVTFPMKGLKKGEQYTYVCTFPGHSALMVGEFKIK